MPTLPPPYPYLPELQQAQARSHAIAQWLGYALTVEYGSISVPYAPLPPMRCNTPFADLLPHITLTNRSVHRGDVDIGMEWRTGAGADKLLLHRCVRHALSRMCLFAGRVAPGDDGERGGTYRIRCGASTDTSNGSRDGAKLK